MPSPCSPHVPRAVTQFMVRKLVTYMLLTAACVHLLATADEPRHPGESGLGDGAGDELVWQLLAVANFTQAGTAALQTQPSARRMQPATPRLPPATLRTQPTVHPPPACGPTSSACGPT